MKIFIGNLNTAADEKDLRKLFLPFGNIVSAKIVHDDFTHRSRGFGYVEMEEAADSQKAISQLNNTHFMRQSLVVHAASAGSTNAFGKQH